jgi:DNA-3-methyladenine glycosylase II
MNKKQLDRAIKHLSRDPVMKKIIKKAGRIDLSHSNDPFESLVYSIIGQQLSNKAASTIYNRFLKLVKKHPPTPSSILKCKDDDFRKCGISYSKIAYLKNLSWAVKSKSLDLKKLQKMPDEQVLKELTTIKGIGNWTVEMFLIFTLKRFDTFSVGDMGLKNAMARHYKIDKKDIQKQRKLAETWAPYRSIAARYLWRSLEQLK